MNTEALDVTECDPDKLRKAWLRQTVPMAIALVVVVVDACLADSRRISNVLLVVLLGLAAAAMALRIRYGLAPTPPQIDRHARLQGCVRVQSMPWLSHGLAAIGVAMVVWSFTTMKLDPEWFFHDPSGWARLAGMAAPIGIVLTGVAWRRPWDATVKRVVDP